MSLILAENILLAIDGRVIVKNISMAGAESELIGLIGPNGAGKSTLLKAFAGISSYTGRISICGEDAARQSQKWLSQKISYLPQDPVIRWPVTGRKLVELGRLPYLDPWRRRAAGDLQAIDRAMALTDTVQFADREIMSLSGGERARVLLARAFATGAPIILADEPVAALDPYHQLHTMELLQEKSRAGCCVIVVLQDLTLAARFCDRLVLLSEAGIIADDKPLAVLTDSHLESAYQISAITVSEEDEKAILPWRRLGSQVTKTSYAAKNGK